MEEWTQIINDFWEWIVWLVEELLAGAVQEAVDAIREEASPWWAVPAAGGLLAIWKLIELVLWVVRKLWLILLFSGAGASLVWALALRGV